MKRKKLFAISGVVMAALLLIGIVSGLFVGKKSCDHVWGEETVVVASTCGTKGVSVKSCLRCDESQYTVFSPTEDHTWGSNTTAGQCQSCGFDVTSFAASAVNVGDVAQGWYRMNKNDNFSLSYSQIFLEDYTVKEIINPLNLSYSIGSMKLSFKLQEGDVLLEDGFTFPPSSSVLYTFDSILVNDFLYFYIPIELYQNQKFTLYKDTRFYYSYGFLSGFSFATVSTVEKLLA